MAVEQGVYDASDQAAVDNQAKESARRAADDNETVRVWMSHPKGRDLLYRMMEECHIFSPSFIAGAPDVTAFNEGERNIGTRLLVRIQRHPDLYMKMMQEQQIEREARNTRLIKQNERKEVRDGESSDPND